MTKKTKGFRQAANKGIKPILAQNCSALFTIDRFYQQNVRFSSVSLGWRAFPHIFGPFLK